MIKKRRNHAEEIEQAFFMQWVENHVSKPYDMLVFAIPNGGKRPTKEVINKKGQKITICPEGRRLKAQGVKKGILDVFVCIPCSIYHGLFLEFKSSTGTLRPEQKLFIKAIEPFNYKWVIVRTRFEAIQAIKDYLQEGNMSYIIKTWQTSI